MTTPILIGLPGAGKSSVGKVLAEQLGLEIVSTDALFRVCRAVGSDDPRPEAEIMRRFLARCVTEYPDQYPALVEAAQKDPDDPKGRCKLHDSTLFRSFGEDVFRLYEIEMNKWLNEQGRFDNAIPDLSASAPLYDENRAIFAPEHGFRVFLLDTPHDQIRVHLLMDYLEHRRLSAEKGENVPLRGAYELAVEKAFATAPDQPEQEIVMNALGDMSQKDRVKRMDRYRAFAHDIIAPAPSDTPEILAGEILTRLEKWRSSDSAPAMKKAL